MYKKKSYIEEDYSDGRDDDVKGKRKGRKR